MAWLIYYPAAVFIISRLAALDADILSSSDRSTGAKQAKTVIGAAIISYDRFGNLYQRQYPGLVCRWGVRAKTIYERVGDLCSWLCGVPTDDTASFSSMECSAAGYRACRSPMAVVTLWVGGKSWRARDEHGAHVPLGGYSAKPIRDRLVGAHAADLEPTCGFSRFSQITTGLPSKPASCAGTTCRHIAEQYPVSSVGRRRRDLVGKAITDGG